MKTYAELEKDHADRVKLLGAEAVAEEQAQLERRYRKGYIHGYTQAVYDMHDRAIKKTPRVAATRLFYFINRKMFTWAYFGNVNKLELPPRPPREGDETT